MLTSVIAFGSNAKRTSASGGPSTAGTSALGATVLQRMSAAGDILVIAERHQLVFHVVPQPSRLGWYTEVYTHLITGHPSSMQPDEVSASVTPAVDAAIKAFNKAVANPSPDARATALIELSKTPHDRTLKAIMPFLNQDVTKVRQGAAKALAEFADWKKIVTPFLASALTSNEKDGLVQVAILEAIAKIKEAIQKTYG